MSRKEIYCSHWRCLWLSDITEPSGPSLLESVTGTSATAVVLVNNIDSFQVDDWVYRNCSLPVVVLCSSSGYTLKSVFDKCLETQVDGWISLHPMQLEENVTRKWTFMIVLLI